MSVVAHKNFATAFMAGAGSMSAHARQVHAATALFSVAGGMNVAAQQPRLTASVRFAGEGMMVPRLNDTAAVLSFKTSVRYTFPTVPNSGDPFGRRPSRGYTNHSGSARFAGAGSMLAIAS